MLDKNGREISVGDVVAVGSCRGWVYETIPQTDEVEVMIGYDNDTKSHILAVIHAKHLSVVERA